MTDFRLRSDHLRALEESYAGERTLYGSRDLVEAAGGGTRTRELVLGCRPQRRRNFLGRRLRQRLLLSAFSSGGKAGMSGSEAPRGRLPCPTIALTQSASRTIRHSFWSRMTLRSIPPRRSTSV